MKSIFRLAVIIMCLGFIASLFGCKAKDKYILDGPGMINPSAWYTFAISRSCDSYAQHNFHITVSNEHEGLVVKGTLLDNDGTEYEDYDGIILPKEACLAIENLNPAELPDFIFQETVTSSNSGDEELIILDAPEIEIEVGYADGRLLQKVDENNFSIEVYEIVLPYFRDKFN